MPAAQNLSRRVAVAVALVAGCAASIATSPGPEECSQAASEAEVSDFYGPQDVDSGEVRWAEPKDVRAQGYVLEAVSVSVSGCVADSTPVPVYVRMDFAEDGTGGAPEDVFASFEVMDGAGRRWSDPEPSIHHPRPDEDGRLRASSVALVFELPLDVQTPVVLLLGDLADEDLDRLVLDPGGEDG